MRCSDGAAAPINMAIAAQMIRTLLPNRPPDSGASAIHDLHYPSSGR